MASIAPPETGRLSLLVATKKGAFVLSSDPARRDWTIEGPHFLGHIVNHQVLDPRDRRTLLLAARTGHLGPTVFRSRDFGETWQEAARPPAFPKVPPGWERPVEKSGAPPGWQQAGRREFEPLPGGGPETRFVEPPGGRVVDFVHWLTPGHASEPDVWYAGTSPQALFRSEDAGDTWAPVSGFNDHPRCTDGGRDWRPLNAGTAADFLPDPDPEFGQDPHCVRLHPAAPDVLYQQNHCGIYRLERPAERWTRIGDHMPREIGDIGFGIALHPRDPATAWVFPMDGTAVWPRTSPGGRPAVYVTRDAGASWRRQDAGLPAEQAWFTVYRQALTADAHDPVGVYFGTTSGEVWASADEGEHFRCVARHLPIVQAVEVAHWEP